MPSIKNMQNINIDRNDAQDRQNATKKTQIENACRDFESLFVNQLMKQMRQTVPQDGLFSGGNAEKIYTSMLDGEMSKTISQHRGIGLAPALIRQLTDLTENDKKIKPEKTQVDDPNADIENTEYKFQKLRDLLDDQNDHALTAVSQMRE